MSQNRPWRDLSRQSVGVGRTMFGVVLCSLVGLATTTAAEPKAERLPNIVLIVADDLGYGELGCYGQTKIRTPVLDELARDGVRFTNFYSGNAVCAPSRCCLLTAKHPGHAYIRNNGQAKAWQHLRDQNGWEFPGQNPIPDEELTLGEVLQNAGYATAAIGKWGLGHFGTPGSPNRQGFDFFYGFNCQAHAHNHYPRFLWRNDQKEIQPGNDRTLNGDTYSQDQFVVEALKFIDEHQEQPFLLYLPFAIPHLSIQVPESTLASYTDQIAEDDYVHKGYLEHPKPRAGYAAMITHMDQGIGQILKRLDELDLDDDTIVVFTSDNGPTYNRLGGSDSDFFESSAGLRGRKGSFYEGGLRVPLIVRWPNRIKANTVRDQPAAFWDLMPTLLDAAGLELPGDIDGVSLLPVIKDSKADPPHDYLYWELPSYGGQQAVRWGKWKGIRRRLLAKPPSVAIELFDLENDPQETEDVAENHPKVVAEIERIMKDARHPSELFPIPVIDQPVR